MPFYPKNASFKICHTPSMDREYLLQLRNQLINTELGDILLTYCQDYLSSEGCKATVNGDEIKGMCKMVQWIKDIPSKCK